LWLRAPAVPAEIPHRYVKAQASAFRRLGGLDPTLQQSRARLTSKCGSKARAGAPEPNASSFSRQVWKENFEGGRMPTDGIKAATGGTRTSVRLRFMSSSQQYPAVSINWGAEVESTRAAHSFKQTGGDHPKRKSSAPLRLPE
jgi:hypothetical protein